MKQLGIRDKILVLSGLNFNYKQIQSFLIFKFKIHIELDRIGRIVSSYKVEDLLAKRYLRGYTKLPNYLTSYAYSHNVKITIPKSQTNKTRKNSKITGNKKNTKKEVLKSINADNSIYNPSQKLVEVSISEFMRILKEESIRIGTRDADLVYQNVKFRFKKHD